METSDGTDMQLGLGMTLGTLVILGTVVLYVAGVDGKHVLSGWGFAAAMLAAGLTVTALHRYGA